MGDSLDCGRKAIVGKNLSLLNILILVLFGVQIFRFGASWTTNYSFNRFSVEIVSQIKRDLFHRVLRFPMSFFAENQTGYIMSRIGEVEGLNFFFSSTLVHVAISAVQFVFCLGLLLHLNTKLTLVSLLTLPILFGISRWFSKDMRQLSWEFYEKSAILSRGMHDSLSGVEVIKSFGAEERETLKFQAHLNALKGMNIRRTVRTSLFSESVSFLGAGAGFVILLLSGREIISEQFTLGSYFAFSAYFAQLFGPTQLMASLGMTLQPAKVALQRIRELQEIVAEDGHSAGRAITSLKGEIDIQDMTFEYEKGKPVLSNVCMRIRSGEKILIAGENGSGKSTLVKLIMGFYQPQSGRILIDGIPMHEISPASLRERISVVSQNTFLFSDSVRNNILYSAPEATQAALEEAVCLSGALGFIKALSRGLDTEIGERGIRLSGGERQKLSIARAILRHSDLIIFDEATTHLDQSSVELLRKVIQNRFAETTCLVISHRPIEIPTIDRAYLLENGSASEVPYNIQALAGSGPS